MVGWFGRDVLVAHTWSLSLEEQFYLLYPALLILLSKRALLSMSVLLLISALIWRFFLYFSMGGAIANPYRFFYSPDTRFDTIIFSCVAELLLYDQEIKEKLKTLFSRVDVFFISVVLLIINFFVAEAIGSFKYTVAFSVNAFCFTSVMLYAILGDQNSAVNRFLSMRALQNIGLLSYSLYLWHPMSLGLAGRVAAKVDSSLMPVTNTVSYILISLFCALTSYFVIEKPFLTYKNRFSLVQAVWKS
jgi:peptidoglycan/LPS O-acetylase OafA/YrhL